MSQKSGCFREVAVSGGSTVFPAELNAFSRFKKENFILVLAEKRQAQCSSKTFGKLTEICVCFLFAADVKTKIIAGVSGALGLLALLLLLNIYR